ncbi:MAG: hypothetical protein WA886_03620 [Candidatus Acidiferrales bacterium]
MRSVTGMPVENTLDGLPPRGKLNRLSSEDVEALHAPKTIRTL